MNLLRALTFSATGVGVLLPDAVKLGIFDGELFFTWTEILYWFRPDKWWTLDNVRFSECRRERWGAHALLYVPGFGFR